ncbi:MAG: hypothetical protein PHU21_00665 [Elusimicrobia bacterium]|jgi:hypothetical protein|nr:hypothetical protein [Elusimicrobiota bacterium]
MIRHDWFKRQVDILAQAIGAVLGLRGRGDIQASISAIESTIRKTFGMDGKLALTLSPEDFLSLACRGERPSTKLLSKLADLFGEWAELLQAQGSSSEAAAALARVTKFRQLASQANT